MKGGKGNSGQGGGDEGGGGSVGSGGGASGGALLRCTNAGGSMTESELCAAHGGGDSVSENGEEISRRRVTSPIAATVTHTAMQHETFFHSFFPAGLDDDRQRARIRGRHSSVLRTVAFSSMTSSSIRTNARCFASQSTTCRDVQVRVARVSLASSKCWPSTKAALVEVEGASIFSA